MPPRSSRSRQVIVPVFVPEAGAVPVPGYRLIRLRGKGGFATVWETEDPHGHRVAMKFMSSANASSTARELRSLQSIQGLTHPSLLHIRDVWSIPGYIVITMDLADATLLDLHELYIEEFNKLIEPEKLGQQLYQVALALDFLNARRHKIDGRTVGLQHGDVKPNNILLVNDAALLADYGLATPTSGPLVPCPRHGTAEYCAPEVFLGYLSERSDQFALAVTYFVLRTGRFPVPSPPADREKLRNYVRPDPDLSPLPYVERPVLARALSAIPQNRYPSCVDLMNAVFGVLGLRPLVADNGSVSVLPTSAGNSHAPKSVMFK